MASLTAHSRVKTAAFAAAPALRVVLTLLEMRGYVKYNIVASCLAYRLARKDARRGEIR